MTTNQDWEKVTLIYDEVIKLEESKQKEYVIKKSQGQQSILEQVLKMLEAKNSQGFMGKFPGKINADNIDLSIPDSLGHFKIIKKIATGGMGRVYLGQSTTADVQIKVALKTIRIELISKELRDKFQNEKNILSQLKHKNIASLIDAGISNNQIPYIATEWVDGLNIKSYCIENNLSIKQRLRLFLQICDAMIFAHNKMIIHRDLKPDNILVNTQEQVKLLDFGIAKIVDENQSSKTQTQIFTPDYAAPEQLSGDRCTAATDIYSLGIILFELLTNSKRFELSNLSITDKIKAISIPIQPDLSEVQSVTKLPYSLIQLKGPLHNIINKAMHVDFRRRYDSVASLVSDVQRYLENRPIEAMKDSFFYKTKMLLVRNKLASGFLALAFIAILSGLFIANSQLTLKRQEVKKTKAMLDFLVDSIQASDPDITKGESVSVIDFLQNAKLRVQENAFDDVLLTSSLQSTIAQALTKVGEYHDAEVLLLESIKNDPNNMQSYISLAKLFLEQGQIDFAMKQVAFLNRKISLLNREEKNQTNLLTALILAEQSEFEEAIRIVKTLIKSQERSNENVDKLIESKFTLVNILNEYDKVEESTAILRETIKLSKLAHGVQSTKTTRLLEQLARNLSNSSPVPWDEVFELYQQSLDNQIYLYGNKHPIVAKTLLNEGFAYKFMGNLEKASNNSVKAREIALENFGENHMLTAHIDLLRSQLSFAKGQLNDAIDQLEKVLIIYTSHYGENHFTTNEVKTTLSAYLIKAKRGKEALANLLPLYESQKEQLGENHKASIYVMLNIIKAYNLLGEFGKSVENGRQTLSKAKESIGSENLLTIGVQITLAQSYINANMPNQAIALCQELLTYNQIINNGAYNKKIKTLIVKAKALQ
jgi:serine/threonine-protein kinase